MKRLSCGLWVAVMVPLMMGLGLPLPLDQEKLYDIPDQPEVLPDRLDQIIDAALDQPDLLTRVQAITTVGQFGLTGLADQVADYLDAPEARVRLEAVKAVAALGHRDAADKLLAMVTSGSADGPVQRQVIILADQTLADWSHQRAVGAWLGRLSEDGQRLALQRSAVAALQRLGSSDTQTIASLSDVLADSSRPITLRMDAAKALGVLADRGLVPTAQALINEGTLGQFMAATILSRHRGQAARGLLDQLARGSEPTVVYAAMRGLFAADPSLVWPLVDQALQSIDPKVRRVAIESLASRVDPVSVQPVVNTFDDRHPQVRTTARQVAEVLAGADAQLKRRFIDQSMTIIRRNGRLTAEQQADRWRETEQAALLLGLLDHKPAAEALLKLYEFNRVEVKLAGVDAIRRLAVPETFEPTHQYMQQLINRAGVLNKELTSAGEDDTGLDAMADALSATTTVAESVAQSLGVWRYEPAEQTLRQVIPKGHAVGVPARAAGIWAIGLIREGRPDKGLAATLAARARDIFSMFPEAESVRLHSVITIGRMQAQSQLGLLREYFNGDTEGLEMRAAAGWAIEQITGEDPGPMQIEPRVRSGAFIMPIRE